MEISSALWINESKNNLVSLWLPILKHTQIIERWASTSG
jgi:hypothetical protein